VVVALTKRGKVVTAVAAGLGITVAGLGALAFTGHAPAPIQRIVDHAIGRPQREPCPLTGVPPAGDRDVPARPLLAVKIENSPDARPQAGLDRADVVYEEPVEGGLTRFIALYHCGDTKRLGPVRSARTTDPRVLAAYGRPLFAYAGGAPQVKALLAKSDLVDLSYLVVDAYVRDPNRAAPHNLYSSTRALWRAGGRDGDPPPEVFPFSEELTARGKRARSAHIPFSYAVDVWWRWSPRQDRWLRAHGSEPHLVESGDQIGADSVVLLRVPMEMGTIRDAAGNPSPELTLTGTGRAWVLRDGRVIAGRWERPRLSDATRLVTRSGEEIALHPGSLWVELVPDGLDPVISATRS
jgi:hypothetical protein